MSVFDLDLALAEEAAQGIRDAGGEAIAWSGRRRGGVQVDAAVERTTAELGPVLVLVNGAGKDGFDPFMEITAERGSGSSRSTSPARSIARQSVLPDMLDAKWGRIVNISSSSAQTGAALWVPLHGVEGRRDRADQDPGARARPARHHRQHHPARGRRHPDEPACGRPRGDSVAGRWTTSPDTCPSVAIGLPEDIAAACAYLVSDEAGYVTGQIIGVNGGRVT